MAASSLQQRPESRNEFVVKILLMGQVKCPEWIEFNAEAARRIEAAYLTTDVVAQRRAVHEALDIQVGERVLDRVGPGPARARTREDRRTRGPRMWCRHQ